MSHRRLEEAYQGRRFKASQQQRQRRLLLERLETRTLLAGDISYSIAGATYSQDFDGLPQGGTYTLSGTAPQSVTSDPINADASMEGWFIGTANNVTNKFAVANTGTAAVYSYGSSTSDRALGGLASGSFAPRYGAVFVNHTTTTLGSVSIAFTEEQWWANADLNGRHVFDYKVGGTNIHDTGFQAESALDLTRIVVRSAQAISGNAANHRIAKSQTIAGLNWLPGQTLVIRWSASATTVAQGMAVDDFSLTAFPLPDTQPIAQDDGVFAATEDIPLLVNVANGVLNNDSGLDDGPLTLSVLTPPAHGAVTLNHDGSFTYTPEANYHGTDGFEYTVIDADGDSATAVATIAVASVDDLTIALNDSYNAVEDTPFTVNLAQGVLANDAGLGDGGLVISIVALPSHGNVTINNDGTFTFTPAENYAGVDSFTYQVVDSDGDSATAVVELNIAADNDLPATLSGTASLDEDTSIEIDLRGLSDDVETSDANLLYEIVTAPSHGVLAAVVGQPGRYTYTPASDYHGNDTFTFRVKDEAGASSSPGSVAITVHSINDAPVLAPIGNRQIDEETAITFTVAANDSRDTPANAVTLSAANLPAGATFDPVTGFFSWTPSESQQGSYSLTFTATDDGTPAVSASETITITVNEVNDAPILELIGNKFIEEDMSLSFIVAASDANDSPANSVVLSVAGLPAGAGFNPVNGQFLWTPAENQQGTYSVIFTATDNGSPSRAVSETITITVGEVNDAPVLSPVGNHSGQEGTLLSFFVQASDPNDDPANEVSLSVLGLPTGASFDPSTGEFSWLPTFSNIGTHTLTFVATDDGSGNLTDSETMTITIASGNLPPTLDPIAEPSLLLEDAPAQLVSLTGISNGGDTFDGELAITAITDNPALLSNLLVSYSGGPSGNLSYQPVANAGGEGTITITVRDAGFDAVLGTEDDGFIQRSFTVTVVPVNDEGAATISGTPAEGSLLTTVLADVEGVPANIDYRWEVSLNGSSDWVAIPNAIAATFIPGQGEVGKYLRVVATYTDHEGNQETVVSEATVPIANVNEAPTDLLLSQSSMAESAAVGTVVGEFAVTDPDGDMAFSYSLVDPSGKFILVNNQLAVNGLLDFEATPSYAIEITVSDSGGATLTRIFTITIENVDLFVRIVPTPQGEEVRIMDDAAIGRTNDLHLARDGAAFIITSRNGQTIGLQGIPGQQLSPTSVIIPASFLDPRRLVLNLGAGHDTVEVDTTQDVVPSRGLQLNLGGQAGDSVILTSGTGQITQSRVWWFAGNGATVSVASIGNISLAGFRIAQGIGGSERFVLGANAAVANLIADGGLEDSIEIHRDGNITLSNDLLVIGNSNWTSIETIIGLQGIQFARLVGGQANNTFDLTAWTGLGNVSAGSGHDTIKLRTSADNPNIALGDRYAAIGGGLNPQSLALAGVERAELSTSVGDAADHTFTLDGWTGATDIQAGDGINTLIVSGNLSNYELGPGGAFKIGVSGIGSSQGIDKVEFHFGSGNNTVRLLQGFSERLATGGLTIQPGSGHDTLEVIADANFAVGEAAAENGVSTQVEMSYHSGGKFALDANHFERIQLTGGVKSDVFTFHNFRGQATVDGGSGQDSIRFIQDADYSLYKSTLQVDGRNFGLANIETVLLEGGEGANHFLISGWAGRVVLNAGEGPAADSLRVITSAANVVLSDSQLRLDQQTLRLSNSIEIAELIGGATDQTFNLSGWSNGAATFDGTSANIAASRVNGGSGKDTIIMQRDADITLTDRWLTYDPVGPSRAKSFVLSNIERAELTGGAGKNLLNAAGFSGSDGVSLHGLAGDDVLIGSSRNDTLRGGAGNDWLAGREGRDTLFGNAGRNILSGGDGVDFLFGGNEEDVLITGRTIYDAQRHAIDAIMAAWSTSAGLSNRVTRLRDQGVGNGYKLNRSTVVDDELPEILSNDGNAIIDDWFLLENSLGPDRDVAGADPGETITDLN